MLPALPLGLAWDKTAFNTNGSISIVQTGNIYDLWKAANFTTAEQADPLISGPPADPDFDGKINALEYALAGLPKSPAEALASGRPSPTRAWIYFGIRFRRSKNTLDVTYSVETNSDLIAGVWTPVAPPFTGVIDNGDGTETVVWHVPVAGFAGAAYIRVKAVVGP